MLLIDTHSGIFSVRNLFTNLAYYKVDDPTSDRVALLAKISLARYFWVGIGRYS